MFVGRETLERFEATTKIVGVHEVGKMAFELFVAVVVVTPDGRFFDGSVHAFRLAIRPWVFDLGEAVFDAIFPAAHVEHVGHKGSRRPVSVAWRISKLDAVVGVNRPGIAGDVRAALCKAAGSMLMRSKKWTALRAWGLWIAKRTSMKNAVIAVARKLAVILHRMWIDGSEFSFVKGTAVIEKRVLIGTMPE